MLLPTSLTGARRCGLKTLVALFGLASFARLGAQPARPVELPAPAHGSAAIQALGAALPDVARAYGLDPQRLVTLFQTQRALGVDRRGSLLFACDGLAVAGAGAGGTGQAMTPDSSVTQLANGAAVDVRALHSLPGASRVILLDFDGHVTRGTSWNASYTNGADIVSAPFDLDGNPADFNDAERAVILSVWRRVAEDFAPFAIDVTTQDPGVEGLRKSSSSDVAYGIRVVISPTNWYNANAGGVAYIGSFSWSSDTPCFAFAAQLANHEKYIAEAVSHEAGHGLSLYHDGRGGTSPTEYYSGQGNWAPIMGVGYYKTLTQFSKGEYADANNTENDLALIASHAPLTADDHGGSLATATVLAVPTVQAGGTIETALDEDFFRFDTGAGAIALTIGGPGLDTNVHLRVELLDGAGNVLLTNASTALNASFTPTLAAGTYYLKVSGVGYGDPKTTGYSDYASVGNYLIRGSVVPIAGLQSPIAQAAATPTSGVAPLPVALSSAGSSDPDGSIVSYRWDLGDGTTSTEANPAHTYQTPGNYTAVLTVTDNAGLSNTASVFIVVTEPPNQPPVAVAGANVTSGMAPLPVTFSSAGSGDPDGTIASYQWNFGDGTSGTGAAPAKTYTTPGNYVAVLTVTDNRGATASSSVAISVARDPNTDVDVAAYTLTRVTSNAGVSASGAIVVRDRAGRVVPNVNVTVQWSGLVSGSSTGKTDANGRVTLTSGRTKKTGTITGTISSVTAPAGVLYDATIYSSVPMSLSITTR